MRGCRILKHPAPQTFTCVHSFHRRLPRYDGNGSRAGCCSHAITRKLCLTLVFLPNKFNYNFRGERQSALRCLELDSKGRQCQQEAMLGKDFCADHHPILRFLTPEASPNRPLIYRIAAIGLLFIFLYNGYLILMQWMRG